MSTSSVTVPSPEAADPAAAWARRRVEFHCAERPIGWPGFKRPIVVASTEVLGRLFGLSEDVTDTELEGIGVRVDAFVTVLPPDLIRVTWAGAGQRIYLGPGLLDEDEAEIYHILRVHGLCPEEAADLARTVTSAGLPV